MLVTSIEVDGSGKVTGLVANDPLSGQTVILGCDESNKQVDGIAKIFDPLLGAFVEFSEDNREAVLAAMNIGDVFNAEGQFNALNTFVPNGYFSVTLS
jgi:hypothetical protein